MLLELKRDITVTLETPTYQPPSICHIAQSLRFSARVTHLVDPGARLKLSKFNPSLVILLSSIGS